MRIGIDARFYGRANKGLGRYTEQLLDHLQEIDDRNEYLVFLREENFSSFRPRRRNFRKIKADFPWYSWSEQIGFCRLLRRENPDLVHFPHFNVPLFYRRPFVVTIHDLILLRFPTRRAGTRGAVVYYLKYLAYRLVIASAVYRAKEILAVSRFTAGDLCRLWPAARGKTTVTYEAVFPPVLSAEEAAEKLPEVKKKYAILKKYILYVGNAYPHKNLSRLIRAFAESRLKDEYLLVLVGRDDFFYRRLRREEAACGDTFLVLDTVSDEELEILYRGAEAFVFPSLYEGFGLPPLEAMSRGVPVASSDHPCMREILADAALFFDAESEEAIREALEKILRRDDLREKLHREGIERANRFSWRPLAEKTLAAYRRAVGE